MMHVDLMRRKGVACWRGMILEFCDLEDEEALIETEEIGRIKALKGGNVGCFGNDEEV